MCYRDQKKKKTAGHRYRKAKNLHFMTMLKELIVIAFANNSAKI